jgi:hypothetical protein
VWQATQPRDVLAAYAEVVVLIGGRATLTRNRRAGAEMVVRKVVDTGPLRPGLTIDRAVDSLWIFNDPAHYATLVLPSSRRIRTRCGDAQHPRPQRTDVVTPCGGSAVCRHQLCRLRDAARRARRVGVGQRTS